MIILLCDHYIILDDILDNILDDILDDIIVL